MMPRGGRTGEVADEVADRQAGHLADDDPEAVVERRS
jgi:hypothetical protein